MTTSQKMQLNLGSGPDAVEGWICIDRSPNLWLDRIPYAKSILLRVGFLDQGHMRSWSRDIHHHDIRRLPFRANSVDAIYTSHVLEHLYLDEAQAVLRECARVLKPEGILRIALPDAVIIAREFLATADSPEGGRTFNARLLAQPVARPNLFESLKSLFAGHVHRWQPTAALLDSMLADAGFSKTVRCGFREGNLPDVNRLEHRQESFFVEAYFA